MNQISLKDISHFQYKGIFLAGVEEKSILIKKGLWLGLAIGLPISLKYFSK